MALPKPCPALRSPTRTHGLTAHQTFHHIGRIKSSIYLTGSRVDCQEIDVICVPPPTRGSSSNSWSAQSFKIRATQVSLQFSFPGSRTRQSSRISFISRKSCLLYQ
ncbi:uncharacterized protein LOC124131842 [Haliotis rufescens]|uniref:uncharacterized protein LOC124131842 n=1 Tax=Haliotis rufescens TaxID=6454 RepID=UPI001EAFFDAF|nr:uncharacterized protein LOC124131842 [Haliotis rufescens]